MPEPYVGEIRMFAGNFAPNGWMFCEGQTLPISENEVLFHLIGTTYGGDGEETFNLPNLASRVPIHMGTGPDGTTYQIGEMAGTEQETLTSAADTESHPSAARLDHERQAPSPAGNVLGKSAAQHLHSTDTPTRCDGGQFADAGGRQPAARKHATVPLYQLHHLAVRGVPEPDLKEKKMSDQFVAEIRIFPFNFPPEGWAFCNGQLLPLSQNTALSRCLERPTAATVSPLSHCPILQGNAPMQPGQGQGLSLQRPRRDVRFENIDAADIRDAVSHSRLAGHA